MIHTADLLAFVLGVWLLQWQPVLPGVWAAVGVPLALLAAAGARRIPDPVGPVLRRLFLLSLWGGVGFCWAAVQAQLRLDDRLAPRWEGEDLPVVGVVASLPQPGERSVRFRFDVERSVDPDARLPSRLLLTWYAADRGASALPEVHPGERWRLTVSLKRPHGNANPHGFDYEVWLLEQGIGATGHVRNAPANRRLAERVDRPGYAIERAREAVVERIARALPQAPYAGVLQALAVGAQGAVPAAQWEVFQRTGVVHLMSISGMHVTLFSALAFGLVHWLWRRSHRLTRRLPPRRVAVLAGAAAALGYALLAGFGVPAQRTVYMLATVAVAVWSGRLASAWRVLALALAAVVLMDPWAVLSPGFWLSYGAVALIFLVGTGRIGRPGRLAEWTRVQWAVTLGLTPPLLALFQQVSLVSPLANAFAVPLISLGVVPLTLLGAVLPLDMALTAAHAVTAFCMALLEPLARLPDAVWEQQAPPAWAVVASLGGIAWALLPRGFPARWLGAFGLLPLMVLDPPRPPPGTAWITVLDVGQGLAVLVRTERHALLYDTGPGFTSEADSGNRIILPFLRGEGVPRLDAVVVSHDDIDHSGGALSVLQGVPVERLLSSLPPGNAIVQRASEHRSCLAGDGWQWDGVAFEVLHPAAGEQAENDNARSCVLKVSVPAGIALLAGDIEQAAEERLLARSAGSLRAELLVAPHHGGKYSSSEAFVAATSPAAVVFSAGYRNRFDHPRPDVVERYRLAGSRIWRTDRDGALDFRLPAARGGEATAYRTQVPRYWRSAP